MIIATFFNCFPDELPILLISFLIFLKSVDRENYYIPGKIFGGE